MKRKIILVFLLSSTVLFASAQQIPKEIPEDVKIKLLELQNQVKIKLDSCRLNSYPGKWMGDYLRPSIYPLDKKVDSLGLRLNWGMVFNKPMRKRMLQLLNNKYPKEEMEELLDRWTRQMDSRPLRFERRAITLIRADTMETIRAVGDSLNKYHRDANNGNLYQTDDVFFFLQLDTFPCFILLVDSLRKVERVNREKEYLNSVLFSMPHLIRTCSYVGDKRFVKPIIKALDNPKTYDEAIEALARMRVEPYRTDYLKKYTQPLEEIKKQTEKDYAGRVGAVIVMIGSNDQDYLLEVSKYLWSSGFIGMTGDGRTSGIAYHEAFNAIVRHIENEDFKELVGNPRTFDVKNRRYEVYNWMQRNYGKYKMKRIW